MIVYVNLKKPEPGKPVSAKWGSDVVEAIKSQQLISGKNVRLTRTNHGTVIDVMLDKVVAEGGEAATDSCVPVTITRYKSGYMFEGVSFTPVVPTQNLPSKLYFPHVTPSSEVPVGTTVLGHIIDAPIYGSSYDQQS